MNALQTFTFDGINLRVFGDTINPFFVAADICNALGIQNPSDAIKSLAPFERSKIAIDGRELNVVNESGLYTMILRCRDAVIEGTPAYRFRVKVTSEILPTIRKTGRYEVPTGDTITNAEQVAIQQAVARRAKKSAANYQTIYRAIKARFQIPRYDQLPRSQFEACVHFIDEVDLRVPEVRPAQPAQPEAPKQISLDVPDHARYLTDNELNSLEYLYRLHKDPYFKIAYKVAYETLCAARSEMAGRFYDVMTESSISLYRIERILDRNGIEHC